MAGPEATIERWVCDQALNKLGVPNVKWGIDGWPDRIFLLPGRPFLIEFKAPGEEPSPRQLYRIKCLKLWNYDVEVFDDRDKALEAISKKLELVRKDYNASKEVICGKQKPKKNALKI